MTEPEIVRRKQEIVLELRMDASFKLLSLLEAQLRRDVEFTLKRKWKDRISRAYRNLCDRHRKQRDGRVLSRLQAGARLGVEDILNALRDVFRTQRDRFHTSCSRAKGHFEFRHWYAHGRFFQITPPVPSPEEVGTLLVEFEKHVFARNRASAISPTELARTETESPTAP
jgi:hypothetical protein